MGKLTDVQIRNWIKVGAPGTTTDGAGLALTLSKAGTAAWILRYSIQGARKECTIGRYPDIPLTKAREIASAKRAEIRQGVDVAAEKQARRAIESDGRRVELLGRDVAIAESVLRGFQNDVTVARARLDVARLALQLEIERRANREQTD